MILQEDLRNYYKCKGQEVPPEWDGEERERTCVL